MLIALQMFPGVLPFMPVLLNHHGFLLTHAPPDAATMTSFIAGVKSVCGANIIGAISSSIPGVHLWGKDRYGLVTQYFWFKIPVASVSNCFRIACKITLCVPRGSCV